MNGSFDTTLGPRGNMWTARRLRLAMYVGGLIAVALIESGRLCHLVGGAVTVVAVLLYWLERPRFLRLAFMWCAGFVLIITYEGINDSALISHLYGVRAFDIACRCLVGSHLAVLLGHDLVFREAQVRHPVDELTLSIRSLMPLLTIGWLVSLTYLVPVALTVYQTGRIGFEDQTSANSLFGALLQGVGTSASIAVPIAAVWAAKQASPSHRLLLQAYAALIIALHFVLGSRFPLLFVIVGCSIVWLAPRPPGGRTLILLAGLATVLALAGAVMSRTRTYGMRNTDVGNVAREFSTDDFFMSEGSVRSMTQAVVFTERNGLTLGVTSSALIVFWVPRAIWPGKPTLIGYWLPREFERRGFGTGFSSAPGFTGSTYVDFGLWGSVLAWFLAGMVFGLLERWCARVCAAARDARVILVAPLYGGTFFAVRSIETSALVLVGVLLAALVLIVISGRRRPSGAEVAP